MARRLGLVVHTRSKLAGKGDRAIRQMARPITPGLLHRAYLVEPGVQIGGERGFRAMAADGALERIERDDVAGAFPDRAEVGVPQQPRGREQSRVVPATGFVFGGLMHL